MWGFRISPRKRPLPGADAPQRPSHPSEIAQALLTFVVKVSSAEEDLRLDKAAGINPLDVDREEVFLLRCGAVLAAVDQTLGAAKLSSERRGADKVKEAFRDRMILFLQKAGYSPDKLKTFHGKLAEREKDYGAAVPASLLGNKAGRAVLGSRSNPAVELRYVSEWGLVSTAAKAFLATVRLSS